MYDDIETFVRLKYGVTIDSDSWERFQCSYPVLVKNNVVFGWNINNKYSDLSVSEQWSIFSRCLIEELCKYELENSSK